MGKEDRFMKGITKQLGIALSFALCMLVSACSVQQQESDPRITPVKPTEQENLISDAVGGRCSIFHFQYSDEIKERKIYLEEWLQGKKINSVLLIDGETDKMIDGETDKTEQMAVVAAFSQTERGNWDSATYRIALRQPDLGSIITPESQTISFPKALNGVAYGGLEKEEALQSNQSYLILGGNFDMGNGVSPIACGKMENLEQLPTSYSDYAITLRLETIGG